jgi:hypothetical protein
VEAYRAGPTWESVDAIINTYLEGANTVTLTWQLARDLRLAGATTADEKKKRPPESNLFDAAYNYIKYPPPKPPAPST